MSPIRMRRTWRWLTAVLLALFLLWLALPRLLGLAAEHWLDIPGLETVRVDIENVSTGHARLREVRAVYRSSGGHRLQIALHDIALDYSLVRRHVERLEIARAELDVLPGQSSPASPWPQIGWPQLPVSEAQFDDLHVTMHWPGRPPLETHGSFRLRQSEGQMHAEFRPDSGVLRMTAGPMQPPGIDLEIHTEWLPETGPAADVRLFIGRQPAQQPAKLVAQLPLPLLVEFGYTLGLTPPLTVPRGTLTLKAEALMGEMAGTLSTLSGEAELTDAGLQATGTTTPIATGQGNPLKIELAGKLRFAWEASVARLSLSLQPGLHWELKSNRESSLQIKGRLDREFAIRLVNGEAISEGELPFTIRSPRWGQWDATLQRVSLSGEAGSANWNTADVQLRIKGQLKQWQRDAVQIRNMQAAGDVALHWSRSAGVRSELALQIGVERLAWSGDSLNKTTWKVIAEAAAKADGDFWKSLALNGEANSPQLKIEQAAGQPLTLGPSRLQLLRFHPARAAGELLLAADAVRIGTWPAADIRTRLRLDGNALHGDGTLLMQGTEVLRFTGSHTLAEKCGNATLTAQQALPTLGKLLQPRPAFLFPLDVQAGDADARFTLDWCARPNMRFDAKGALQLRDAALSWEKARIKGLQTTLQLDGLHPLRGRIQLAAPRGELATGTPITDLKVDLALSAGELTVHELHAGVLGGSLRSGPHSLPWPASEQLLPLKIQQIDLGQLLALLKVQGLSGSGQLDGVLPLAYHDGSMEITDGQLSSRGSGTLKYAPVLSIPDNLGLLALRDFQFRQLGVHLWYASDGAYRTQATLEGKNPELYNGYPIRFKLNINGELPGLFRSALFSGDFNRHILEQLQSGKLE